MSIIFQSTRLSRASTMMFITGSGADINFNPQGSREPRPANWSGSAFIDAFQSTRLSRASTCVSMGKGGERGYFNPQGSREPRHAADAGNHGSDGISIHKALASLDG